MKLYELISFEPKQSKKELTDYKSKLRLMKADELGNGSFGAAYDTKSHKRPDQITKVAKVGNIGDSSRRDIEDDGYLVYLKVVLSSGIDNPYFPRVDDLTIRTNPDTGRSMYRVNLQKLVPFSSDKIYGNDDLMESLYNDMFTEKTTSYDDYGPAGGIKYNISNMADIGNFEKIKDPELKQALEIILKLQRDNNFQMDLHSGNMMWRITGFRPQLVLTDPLA